MSVPYGFSRVPGYYMNYGTPLRLVPVGAVPLSGYGYSTGSTVVPTATSVPYATAATGMPYAPVAPAMDRKQAKKQAKQLGTEPKQRLGCNKNYLLSPLGWLRLFVIIALIGVIVAACTVPNRRRSNRISRGRDKAVWISILTFACVGWVTSILIFLFNVCNCINVRPCRLCPCTILIALFDLGWFAALTVLASFCAHREHANRNLDHPAYSVNKAAFGVTSAFGFLSALIFLALGLIGLAKCRAPKRGY